MRSREVKGESVGQGQGEGGSDRDNLTDPGEAVTTSEVRGGINSEEEGEKGIRVERMDGQRVGREERRDGGKERGRDRGEGVAVENDMDFIQEGNRAPVCKVTRSRYREGLVIGRKGDFRFEVIGAGGIGFSVLFLRD